MMRAGRALLYGAALLWIAAAAGGSIYMFVYESRPAPAAELAQVWPDSTGLARNANGFSLVMAVHPKCSCTRASVAELNKLMLGWGGSVHAIALVTKPFEVADLWSETDVTARLREIPNVLVVRDLGDAKADAFGAKSSGQTLLYDADGRLVFEGGITAFRGHEGPSVGGEALKQIVAGNTAPERKTKVFGCSLKDEFCPAHWTREGHERHDHGRDDHV
jgi:hypothetical protein